MVKRLFVLLLSLALLTGIGVPALAAEDRYTDVPEGAWYEDAVAYVSRKEIMTGIGSGRFDPDGTVSRAQLAQILYTREGKPAAEDVLFSDVPQDHWAQAAIRWAVSRKLAAGTGDGTFGPEDPVTREQLAAILYRYADSKGLDCSATGDLSVFPDENRIRDYAVVPLQWAVGHVLLAGTDGKLDPQGSTTRAQMAVILKAFDEKIASAGDGVPGVPGTYEVETIDISTRYPTDAVIYRPVGSEPDIGIVFYAGNPVDYRDYGTLLTRIASAGYLVISPEFPLDTAALNVIAGEEYMKQYPGIREWFLAGHSHGGGVSTVEVNLRPDLFRGMILIDPVIGVPVLKDGLPVLCFHATEDYVVNWTMHQVVMAELAATDVTEFIIEGGNHAQFGDYGVQMFDGAPKISKEEQLDITIREIMAFLRTYQ